MGLIKAAVGAAGSVLADQWRECFYCDSMSENVLMSKGSKRTGKRSSNTKGSDNIITNGSVIVVNEGQAMMIVEQGKIVEFSAEAGEFLWDASTEGTIFYGGLGKGLKDSWNNLKSRFTFGADTGKDQRVYFFNTKEIMGNKYGTPAPVPFRIVDKNVGLDFEASLRCNGEYTYQITDPILFYKKLAGNVPGDYTRDKLDSQLKSQFLTCLQPAFAKISEMGIRYSSLPGHTLELSEAMDDALTQKWSGERGISIVSVSVNSVSISPEDEAMLKELQKTAVFRSAAMGAAYTTMAQGEAMKSAASNPNGSMMGFMGMGMAQQVGGINASQLYEMAAQQNGSDNTSSDSWKCVCGASATGKFCPECGSKKPEMKANTWKCTQCGAQSSGKFCMECGAKKPDLTGWTCSCGTVNKGKFCCECGAMKPADAPLYRCDKCGWEPEDPKDPPKFCPECGDRFTAEDIQ